MNRTIELIRLVKVCERIDGRKKLQKIVHLLKEAGHPLDYRFGFHFHGPFSAELKGEIDLLTSEQLIEETCGSTDSGSFPQFSYAVSSSADALLQSVGGAQNPEWGACAKSLNKKSAQELESISTIVYLIRHGVDEASLNNKFKELKPHLFGYLESSKATARQITKK